MLLTKMRGGGRTGGKSKGEERGGGLASPQTEKTNFCHSRVVLCM